MRVPVGKPVLALLSAACIAVPATLPTAQAAPLAGTSVEITAANAPTPDPNALLELLTFPYHNAYGISIGIGTAANSGLQAALLPLSIAGLVAMNKADQIPTYTQTVQTNLANAIPTIIQAIQAEIDYDRKLFSQFGASSQSGVSTVARAATPAEAISVLASADPGTTLLQLLTFPYHNVYGISIGLGTAANSVLQLALLPLSVGSLVAMNKTDQIPAYIQTVQTNLANAIPTVINAVQAEIAYDQNLFSQFGASQQSGVTAAARVSTTAAPSALAAAAPAAVDSNTLLQLLTFPYHNVYGISIGLGTAANSVLQLALLPLSVGSLVAMNKTDQIPAYIQTVQTNLANAIPTVINAVQAEIAYDQKLFSQFGSTSTTQPSVATLAASSARVASIQAVPTAGGVKATTTHKTVDKNDKVTKSDSGKYTKDTKDATDAKAAAGTTTTSATKTTESTPEKKPEAQDTGTKTGATGTTRTTKTPETKPDTQDATTDVETTPTGDTGTADAGSTPAKKAGDTAAAQSGTPTGSTDKDGGESVK